MHSATILATDVAAALWVVVAVAPSPTTAHHFSKTKKVIPTNGADLIVWIFATPNEKLSRF